MDLLKIPSGRAFLAGVTGGAAMSVVLWVAREAGMPARLEMWLGTWLGLPTGPAAWALGFVLHLLASGFVGLIYAWTFMRFLERATPAWGAIIGLVHAVVAGLFFGALPAIHPLLGERLAAPGPWFANLGVYGVIALFVVHALYGWVVGAIEQPAHPRQSGDRPLARFDPPPDPLHRDEPEGR